MTLLKWKKNIGKNITELKADNKKSGKAKGANWTVRPMKQILAIALSTAKVKPKSMESSKKDKKMDIWKKEMKVEKKEYKKTSTKKK